MWRLIFSSTYTITTITIIVLIINFGISAIVGDGEWFQRSGSIVVVLGVLVAARRVIRLGDQHINEDWNLPDETLEGKKVLLDQRAQYIIGPAIALAGTIVWGYGDLLFRALYVSSTF